MKKTIIILVLAAVATAAFLFGAVTNGWIDLPLIGTPPSPAAGFLRIYPKSGNSVYQLTSGGVESLLGGGGNGYGTYASLPASPGVAGASYKCSDCPFMFFSNGSAWQAFFGNDSLVTLPPTIAGGSWTQLNSPTVADLQGSILLTAPAAATDSMKMIAMTWNAANGATALFREDVYNQYSACGLAITDGAKYETFFGNINGGLMHLQVNTYSSQSAYNGTTQDGYAYAFTGAAIWMRLTVSGSNQIWATSHDGRNWFNVLTESATAYLTPSKVGVTCDSANGSFPAVGELLSWSN